MIVWASTYYAFPALLPAWERDLGWSKTELSFAFTISLVVSASLIPITGRLIDRGLGPAIFAGGAALGALLLGLLCAVTELWQFYCIWIGLGVAMSSTLYEACFALLVRSTGDQARRAITIVSIVAGLAGTVAFPGAHLLTGAFGWRGAVLVFAAAVGGVALPLIWRACRHAEARAAAAAPAPAPSATATQALAVARTAVFWLFSAAIFLAALDHGGTDQNAAIHLYTHERACPEARSARGRGCPMTRGRGSARGLVQCRRGRITEQREPVVDPLSGQTLLGAGPLVPSPAPCA